MVVHKCLILPDQYLKLLFEFGDPCVALLHGPNKSLGDCCIVQPRTSFGWGLLCGDLGLVEREVWYIFCERCTSSRASWQGPGRPCWSSRPSAARRDIWAGFFFDAAIVGVLDVFDVGVVGGEGVRSCDCCRHV